MQACRQTVVADRLTLQLAAIEAMVIEDLLLVKMCLLLDLRNDTAGMSLFVDTVRYGETSLKRGLDCHMDILCLLLVKDF